MDLINVMASVKRFLHLLDDCFPTVVEEYTENKVSYEHKVTLRYNHPDALLHFSEFLSSEDGKTKVENGVGGLQGLSADVNNLTLMALEGTVGLLAELLRACEHLQAAYPELKDASNKLFRKIIATLLNMAVEPSVAREIIGEDKVLEILVMILEKFTDVHLQQLAACTLRNLCLDETLCKIVGNENGMLPLLHLLRKSPDPCVQRNCADGLRFLCIDNEHAVTLIKAGVVKTAVAMLSRNDPIVQTNCAYIISALSVNFIEAALHVRQEGGVPLLISMLHESQPLHLRRAVSNALANLSSHTVQSRAAFRKDIIPTSVSDLHQLFVTLSGSPR